MLFLTHRVPYPPDKGDRIRSFHILRYLSERTTVHLATLADEPVPATTLAALQRFCPRVAVVPLGGAGRWGRALGALVLGRTITEGAFNVPAFRQVIRAWTRDTAYHSVLVSASSLVPYLRMPELQEVRAIVDLVDVDSQKWLDYASVSRGPRTWLYRTEARRLRLLEQQLPTWAHAVTLVSEAETQIYREFCAPGPVHTISNGVDLDYFQPCPVENEQGCVFVGALDYRPNVDGICWFCNEIWPEIHRQRPSLVLRLVGRNPVPAVSRLAEIPGVEVVGQVPDVRPYVNQAAVAIAPLRIARGVQNKVLESLAMGKATAVSLPSLAGLQAQPNKHLLLATSHAEWIESVLRLLDDPALRSRLGRLGRQYVEENHRWDRCLEQFGHLITPQNGQPSLNGTVKPVEVKAIYAS